MTGLLVEEKDRLAALASRGDSLTVWLDADPRTLVPLADPTEWTVRIASDTVFEGLFHYRPGKSERDPGGIEPLLARSWRTGDGGKQLHIELQPDVKFHDGGSMSSVDVQFSIDLARSPRAGAAELRRGLSSVSAVELAGPRGVRIYLHRSDATVLRALADVPILRADKSPPGAGGQGAPAGTGPYRIDLDRPETAGDATVRLARWDQYWGAVPAIPQLVFRHEPDAARALGLARAGEIDLLPELIPAHVPVETRQAGGAELAPVRLRPPGFRYLVLNSREPPFDDVAMRCALHHLIDRAQLAAVRRGLSRPVHGPIWPGGPGDGPEGPGPAGDRAAAEKLLDAAGWHAGAGGTRERGGRRLLVTVLLSDRPDRERDLVLEQLRAAGFVLDTRVGSPAVLDNRLRSGKFDLAFVEWRGPAGADLAPLFSSGGAHNAGGFRDARVDHLFGNLRQTWEPAARWRVMGQLGRLLAETCPIIPLTAPDPVGLVSRRVQGMDTGGGWPRLRALSLAR